MSTHDAPPRRRYTSPLRAAQAADTRRRILEGAGRSFESGGYAGTTLGDIAVAAGVSVESVHAHGPKSALLLSAIEQAFARSEGTDSILDRPETVAANDQLVEPIAFIRATCTFLARAAARSARLWLVMYHAQSEDEVIAQAYRDFCGRVRVDTLRLVQMISERGGVLSERPVQHLADQLEVLYFPTTYEKLVLSAGWSVDAYAEYLFENTCWALLTPRPASARLASQRRRSQ
jgi:AcrR family transcriptional regulator